LLWTSARSPTPPPYLQAPKRSSKKATAEPEEGAGGAGDEEVAAHEEPAKKVSDPWLMRPWSLTLMLGSPELLCPRPTVCAW